MLEKIKIDKTLLKQIVREKKKRDREIADSIERKEKPPIKFNLPSAIICDIDGTLAIRGERAIYDFEHCDVDRVCQEVKQVLDMTKNQMETKILLVTGRDEIYRGATDRWLLTNAISYDTLYMRSSWDRNQNEATKEQIYKTFIKDKFNILFVMEDTKQAIQMWKAQGLYVFNCDQR